VLRVLVAVAVGLLTSQIGIVCTTVYLHRTVTHKAALTSSVSRVNLPGTYYSSGTCELEGCCINYQTKISKAAEQSFVYTRRDL